MLTHWGHSEKRVHVQRWNWQDDKRVAENTELRQSPTRLKKSQGRLARDTPRTQTMLPCWSGIAIIQEAPLPEMSRGNRHLEQWEILEWYELSLSQKTLKYTEYIKTSKSFNNFGYRVYQWNCLVLANIYLKFLVWGAKGQIVRAETTLVWFFVAGVII